MSQHLENDMSSNGVTACFSGTIQKIIRSVDPEKPDKVQIVVQGAEDLYREIRVDNIFQREDGDIVNLTPGDEVRITIVGVPRLRNLDPQNS
ncbi:MAG: hypothetical protein WAK20_08065 [Candidatus Acidiferrum sp.]